MWRSWRSGRRPARAPRRTRGPAGLEFLEDRRLLADVSAPAILEWFDGSYATIENRAADFFQAGYGSIWTPPSGRADTSNFSVGYDPFDRFDLGSPGNPTLYGTETGLKSTVDAIQRTAADYYLDFVVNHNGYSDLGSVDGQGHSFYDAGGYPGFNISLPGAIDGDFHSAFAGGDIQGRVAGLIDIAQETNFQMIRSPVAAGDPNNIRAGTQAAFGRLANVPDANNARFYPDRGLAPMLVFDPKTGEGNIPIYPFNENNPLAGDAVAENAMGYLMRNAQWLVQAIGVDGFRLDATKHVENWVLEYLDRAVYRASHRNLLDGSQRNVFSFGEAYSGDQNYLQGKVRKDINPAQPGVIGGNRDTLDFPLFFALRDNLTGNPAQNNWSNVRSATFDLHDDGLHNGSQGVMFVQSHDDFGPYLSNVAHAYVLMHPGNAVVYFNGKEFGAGRDFPKDGRGDALGGLYGDAITKLLEVRNTHGRGNYAERWVDAQGNFAFERGKAAVVMLSNALDPGYTYDSRTLQTTFDPGTPLLELTGNAADPAVDPPGQDDFPSLVVVNADRTINVRFPHNENRSSVYHGKGYFVYGVATPQGTLGLTNVAEVLPGGLPTAGTNGTTRLADVDVIAADTFQVQLDTVPVNLLGSVRDADADGDNALVRIDAGLDVNGNGQVDFRTPGSAAYGFESMLTKSSPLWGGGDGQYRQTVSAAALAEGTHFITVRAFRHRADGGPAVWTDFKQAIYVDRLPPQSAVESFNPLVPGVNQNRRALVRSLDLTADNVHVFLDLPGALSEAQVLAQVGAGSQSVRRDRDLFAKDFAGLTSGNHVLTVVAYEPTGHHSVQRLPGYGVSTIFGAGLGDLDHNGQYNATDVALFGAVLSSNNSQFNPAADLDADGLVTNADLLLLGPRLVAVNASATTIDAYNQLVASVLPATIGGQVWDDANGDGLRQAGESGLGGVTLRLRDAQGAQVASVVTGAGGTYGFGGLQPIGYQVEVVRPVGYAFSPANVGGDDAIDSDVDPATARTELIALAAGATVSHVDGGLHNPPPTAVIAPIASPTSSAVAAIAIGFSETIVGFDLADLRLARDGGPNLLTPAQSLQSTDGISFTLAGLAGLTASDGVYTLNVVADGSNIRDEGGQPLAADATMSWTLSTHFVVVNTSDGGLGSLRQAILDVNATSGVSPTIDVAIPGPGPHPVQLAAPLPPLAPPTTIHLAAGQRVEVGTATPYSFTAWATLTKTGPGTLAIGSVPVLAADSVLHVAEGAVELSSDLGEHATVIVDGRLDVLATLHLDQLSVAGAGQVSLGTGSLALAVGDLSLAAAGRLDLAGGALIVHATAATRQAALQQVTAWLASGFAAFAWTGPGIASSAAAADTSTLTALGVMLNDDGLGGAYRASFAGEPVGANDVLVKFTYYGDADLSGTVDGTDYALTDNGFNAQHSRWLDGNYNYDPAIDGTDYALIDNAFNSQGGPLAIAPPPAAPPAGEPVGLGGDIGRAFGRAAVLGDSTVGPAAIDHAFAAPAEWDSSRAADADPWSGAFWDGLETEAIAGRPKRRGR